MFENRAPALSLLCAAPGYGKSILAAQFARIPLFDGAIWVSFDGHARSGDTLLGQVNLALAPPSGSAAGQAAERLPVMRTTNADGLLGIRETLSRLRGERVCLVLDGLDALDCLEDVLALARILRVSTDSQSRLVVTCRGLVRDDSIAFDDIWLLDEHDLRFRREEVLRLLETTGADRIDARSAEWLLDQSGGQPALLSLMVRHPNFVNNTGADMPRDLLWHLEHVVSRLDDDSIRVLYVAALLREGYVSEVTRAVAPRPYDFRRLSIAIPLLSVASSEVPDRPTFHVHAVLADALCEIAEARLDVAETTSLRGNVLHVLQVKQDLQRLAAVLITRGSSGERADWCRRIGAALLRSVGPGVMHQCLALVAPEILAASPSLLLLLAATLRQQEETEQSMAKARIAPSLAANAGDWAVRVEASLLMARLALDVGDIEGVRDALAEFDVESVERMPPEARCLYEAYMAVADAQMGRRGLAEERVDRVLALIRRVDPSSEAHSFAVNAVAGVRGLCFGRWSEAVHVLAPMSDRRGVPPVQRLLLASNQAAAVLEMGRLDRAEALLSQVLSETEVCDMRGIRGSSLGTLALVKATLGATEQADQAHREAVQTYQHFGDLAGLAIHSAQWALVSGANSFGEGGLTIAESALAYLVSSSGSLLFGAAVEISVAASLLHVGDRNAAVARVRNLRPELVEAGALYHLLAVDMVLAQAAWEEGALDEAVEYLALHESYILSESSNWQIAMYVRAFPALLSVVARAVGVSEVPIHLLRLVPTEQAEAALAVADRLLTSEEVQSLAARLGAAVSDGSAAEQTERPLAPCRVKLFGGLEVTTEAGVVEDSAWQKRKSRLLFAMLVVRRGQDLPRDVILEYLWPNMDDARARNNFYVIWSTMKRALENADGSGGPASRFVKSSGGLCRVTRLVRSDLDDFEETVGNLRSAQAAGDGAAVLVHARRLMEIYRGELLPGDLYDDWFAETRDRIRHDFCDAMLSAARVAEARNELDHALVLLRSASAADPWREDVYQTTMRCQMSAGQRSRAIETYLSCRTRLVDDLGIDPSAETTRLYQAILAMEDEGARGSGGWSKGS